MLNKHYLSSLDIWNLSNGIIINSITLDKNKTIVDVSYRENVCLMVSKENDGHYFLAGFTVNK